LLIWLIGGATVGVAFFALYFGQRIAKSIARMTAAMQKLAFGDLSAVLPGLKRRDEVGDMARAVEEFKVKAKQAALDEADTRLAQGQMEAKRRQADMNNLANVFEVEVGKVIEAVFSASARLEGSAGSLTATAEQSQKLTAEPLPLPMMSTQMCNRWLLRPKRCHRQLMKSAASK
jgi:methyl-accepting chemotaxis protein